MKFIIVVIGMVMLLSGNLAAQQVNRLWNYDTDKVGTNASGFTTKNGKWEIVADSDAFSSPNVLAQMAENSGSTFNMTLHDEACGKDVKVSVMMKSVSGEED